jgi:uracil-DNA glycosylase
VERASCSHWLDEELKLISPELLILVGRLAIDRFVGPESLDAVVGRRLRVSHAGGESLALALPHPSGASSWPHKPANKALLDRAIELLASEFVADRARRTA